MKLLVDLGNTRIKWALCEHDLPGPMQSAEHGLDLERVFDSGSWRDMRAPDSVLCCNVTGPRQQESLTRYAQDHWQLRPVFATSEERCGRLINAYADPATMGADRWLALVGGAAQCSGAFAVVDAGTAVTVDAVAASGQHLGGWILPGRDLMYKALARGTAQVDSPALETSAQWGQDTAGCVASGIAAALGGVVLQMEQLLLSENCAVAAQPDLYVCGGDGAWIRQWITGQSHWQPDLVLRGLATWSC